jgi:hypothetical protein
MSPRMLFVPLLLVSVATAHAFCGFYVAGGDAKLYNHRSQVALVRDGDRTVLTLASDYEGDPREFALVVPVPVVLQRGQIHVADSTLMGQLDAFSAPRLVEYFDEPPCQRNYPQALGMSVRGGRSSEIAVQMMREDEGVRIEARYEVDEYNVLILSADDSGALLRWLTRNGYRVPMQAKPVVQSYLAQGMKFFVAKVDLRRRAARGLTQLRPLQIAYESPRFMLPVRLGMANANGPQELFVYAVTRTGRVEAVNYRNVRVPEETDVPEFVKADAAPVWRAAFDRLVDQHGMGVVFTEYAWNMAWCDPCPTQPLSREQLQQLGVWWLDEGGNTFMTRLHARYDRASFPEDLVLQVTADSKNFQSRLVVRHEWNGPAECEAVNQYRQGLPARRERQARALATLTGWPLHKIRADMQLNAQWQAANEDLSPYKAKSWWEKLWPARSGVTGGSR